MFINTSPRFSWKWIPWSWRRQSRRPLSPRRHWHRRPTRSLSTRRTTPRSSGPLFGRRRADERHRRLAGGRREDHAGAYSVSGNLCLQKTRDTYRVELREYYLDASLGHQLIATADSRALTGNNGALNQSAVNLQLPRVFSAAVHHAHFQLQKQDSSGAWTDVAGGVAFVDY